MSDGNTAAMVELLKHQCINVSTSLSKPAMSPGDTVLHYSITPHTTHPCAVCPAEPLIVCMAGAATSVIPEQNYRRFLFTRRYDRGILVRVLSDNNFSFRPAARLFI